MNQNNVHFYIETKKLNNFILLVKNVIQIDLLSVKKDLDLKS